MAQPVLLADHPPTFAERGGLFYIDVGIENVPVLAFTPHDLLMAIAQARTVYEEWISSGSPIRRLRRS